MHPDIARALIARHHQDLNALARGGSAAAGRGARRRRLTLPRPALPYWRVTWSRVAAAPASGKGGRAWLIVISASRRMA